MLDAIGIANDISGANSNNCPLPRGFLVIVMSSKDSCQSRRRTHTRHKPNHNAQPAQAQKRRLYRQKKLARCKPETEHGRSHRTLGKKSLECRICYRQIRAGETCPQAVGQKSSISNSVCCTGLRRQASGNSRMVRHV